MRVILTILFVLFCGAAISQTRPSGFPAQKTTTWHQFGYVGGDSAILIARRDTLGFLPRFSGSLVMRPQDRRPYIYDSLAGRWFKFTFEGDIPVGTFFAQDGNTFADTGRLGTNDNFPLLFETNNTRRGIITGNGQIGLGTLSPAAFLDVNGVSQFRDSLKVKNVIEVGDASINGIINLRRFSDGQTIGQIHPNGSEFHLAATAGTMQLMAGITPKLTVRTSGISIGSNSNASFASILEQAYLVLLPGDTTTNRGAPLRFVLEGAKVLNVKQRGVMEAMSNYLMWTDSLLNRDTIGTRRWVRDNFGTGSLTAADDGLSVSSPTIKLGQTVGMIGDPAALLTDREIPVKNFRLKLRGETTNHFTSLDSSGLVLGIVDDTDSVRLRTNVAGSFLINNGAKNTHTFLKAGGIQFTGNSLYFNSDGTTNGVNIYNTGVSGSSTTAVFRSTNNFATMVGAGAGGPNLASIVSSSGFGYNALSSLAPAGGVTGWNNSAFGTNSLKNATTAYGNVMMGINTGFGILSGSLNVGLGGGSLSSIITDSFNTAVGLYSFSEPASLPTLKGLKGRMNTVMGYRAGLGNIAAASWVGTSTNVSSSLFLGAMSGVVAEGDDILNTTILGTNITTNLDSVSILARADQLAMIGYTIATSKRAEKLQVNGSGWYRDSLKVGEMPVGTVSDSVVVRDAVTKTLKLISQASLSGSPSLTTNQIGVGIAGVLGSYSGFTYDAINVKQENATASYSGTSTTAGGSTSGFDFRGFLKATPSAADQVLARFSGGTLDGGTTENITARIEAVSNAAHTPGVSEPTRWDFYVTGTSTPIRTLQLLHNGRILLGGTATTTGNVNFPAGSTSVAQTVWTPGTFATTPVSGGLEYNGTSWGFTVGSIRKRSAMFTDAAPAAGSIIQGNATDFTLLALGTANQILHVNSGATALEYINPNYTLLYSDTSTTTVANTTTETTLLGNGVGSLSFAGTMLVPGSVITLKGSGNVSTAASAGTPTFTFTVGSVAVGVNFTGLTNSLTNANYEYEFEVYQFMTGNNKDCFYKLKVDVVDNGVIKRQASTGLLATTFSSTGTITCNVTGDWNTADPSNSIISHGNTVEVKLRQ